LVLNRGSTWTVQAKTASIDIEEACDLDKRASRIGAQSFVVKFEKPSFSI